MAEDNIDDILTRLDEVEKLQAELRHLVPRVTSGSSSTGHARHQDLARDSPTSIRFPSLFTFPAITNFTSTSKNERAREKSAARLNLNSKSLGGGNRHSTVNLRNAEGTRETTNVFKTLLRTNSYARNSSASTSVVDSKAPTRTRKIASRVTEDPRETIKKSLKSETSRTAVRDKMQRATGERSNVQLLKSENVKSNIRHSGSRDTSHGNIRRVSKRSAL